MPPGPASREDRAQDRAQDQAWLRIQAYAARRTTLPIAALGLAATAAAILQAWCIATLVAPLLTGDPPTSPALWATLFAAAALARAALGLLSDRRAVEAGSTARRRLRTGFLVAAFTAGPYGPSASGATGLTTAIDRIEALDPYFARWMPTAALAIASPVLVLLAITLVDPSAAGILALGGLAVPIGMAVAGIGAAVASAQQFAALTRLQSRFLDRIRGIATIVLAGQTGPETARLQAAATDLRRRTMRVLRVAFLSSAVLDAAAAATLVILALRAGSAWRSGTIDLVAAIFTLVLVAEFFAPLRAFAAAYQDSIQAAAAAAALRPTAPPAAPSAAPPAILPAEIRTIEARGIAIAFENVAYTWDPARGPALQNLTFRVPPNETAILVGPSGAGKSTVLELLLGFIHPQAGRITLNGMDLATITPAALSRITAWIGQRPVLFAGTVRDNIAFGRNDASTQAIAEAARAAGLDPVLATLPGGLETRIGDGGYGLSGGQAQRVAIARAFLRQAPLLLLDEPTAHLDPATEADVLDSLRRLAIGRTVLMTAHSSAARTLGGRIVTLDAGSLAPGTQSVA